MGFYRALGRQKEVQSTGVCMWGGGGVLGVVKNGQSNGRHGSYRYREQVTLGSCRVTAQNIQSSILHLEATHGKVKCEDVNLLRSSHEEN